MFYPFEFSGGSTLHEGPSVRYFHQPGRISVEAERRVLPLGLEWEQGLKELEINTMDSAKGGGFN